MTAGAARYRGRFAPSPTGPLHFGSLLAAFASWLDARHHGGEWLLRIEDVDRQRELPGAAERQLHALAAFGLQPDAAPVRQTGREALYEAALQRLQDAGHVFRCGCSRSMLAMSGGIHRRCLRPAGEQAALRLRLPPVTVGFVDRCVGDFRQALADEVGDIVLRRADGLWAYQLAVVVDDALQGITDVVRGADLLDSTPRQIWLQRALGLPTPRYLHIPLVLDVDGHKLSKSNAAVPVDPDDPLPALRLAWQALGQDARLIAGAGGTETLLSRAAAGFAPQRIGTTPWWPHELSLPSTDRPSG